MTYVSDYTTYRLEQELGIFEADSESQKKYKKFFKNKLQQHGVESPAKLDDAGKKKFFGEIKDEWKNVKVQKESEYFDEKEWLNEVFFSIVEGLIEEPKPIENLVTYITHRMNEEEIEGELNVQEIIESLSTIFIQLVNEEDSEDTNTYIGITDKFKNLLETDLDKAKVQFKKNLKNII